MKIKVFSIYDCKSQCYSRPFFSQAVGSAIRAFEDAVNQKGSDISRHPEDFTLFEIAEFDDATAVITPLKAHQNLGVGIEFKRSGDAYYDDADPKIPFPVGN